MKIAVFRARFKKQPNATKTMPEKILVGLVHAGDNWKRAADYVQPNNKVGLPLPSEYESLMNFGLETDFTYIARKCKEVNVRVIPLDRQSIGSKINALNIAHAVLTGQITLDSLEQQIENDDVAIRAVGAAILNLQGLPKEVCKRAYINGQRVYARNVLRSCRTVTDLKAELASLVEELKKNVLTEVGKHNPDLIVVSQQLAYDITAELPEYSFIEVPKARVRGIRHL